MRLNADPVLGAIVAFAVLFIVGVAASLSAANGASKSVDVAEQVAYLVSGGIGGLALAGFAAGIIVIEARRWAEAQRRARFDRVLTATSELLAAARAGTEGAER